MPSQEPRPTEPTERAQLHKAHVSQAAGTAVTEAVPHSSHASAPPPEPAPPSRAVSSANKPVTKGSPYSWGKYFLPPRKPTAVPASRSQEQKALCEAPAAAGAPSGRKATMGTTEAGGVTSEPTVMLDVHPYVRYPLLVMNLLIWVVGLVILLVGTYAYLDTWAGGGNATPAAPSYSFYSTFLIKMELTVMLFGLVTMSLTFCGCVGALRENTCLLNVYSSFITALLLLNLIAGLVVFFLPSQIKKLLAETFSIDVIVHYRDSSDFQSLMDSIQVGMRCCGISRLSFRDWNANMYFNCSRTNPSSERCSVPFSCCKRNSSDQVVSLSCGSNVLNMTDYDAWFQVYTGNCLDAAHRFVRENVTIITGVCLVFVILLAFVQMVTQALVDEILTIRRIYDKYYERASFLRAATQPDTEPSAN
ncbi:tetraspanin-33-like [Haemaphysalis longicornis]